MAARKQTGVDRTNQSQVKQRRQAEPSIAHIGELHRENRVKSPGRRSNNYYRIVVRPKNEFSSFRYHDVGEQGHILRLAGRRQTGVWDTQAWLISKDDAHIEDDRLVTDSKEAKDLIKQLHSELKMVGDEVFEAVDLRNIPQKVGTRKKRNDIREENIRDSVSARIQR